MRTIARAAGRLTLTSAKENLPCFQSQAFVRSCARGEDRWFSIWAISRADNCAESRSYRTALVAGKKNPNRLVAALSHGNAVVPVAVV